MMIDIHTHVLPEIDDGARDWDTCLTMLERSAKSGVTKVIATPHYFPRRGNVCANQIKECCEEAQKKLLEKHRIAMDIYCGNEIYYSVDAIQCLKEGKALTLAESRYTLIEFDVTTSYHVLYRAVKEFRDAGYIPIIAHMERYASLNEGAKRRELREMGALFQMNIEAIQGGYFRSDSRRAKKYLLEKQVDFLASDMHGIHRRTPVAVEELQWVHKRLSPKYQKDLLYENAQKILDSIEE